VISISALSQRHPKPATFNAPPYNRNGATQSPLGTTTTPNGLQLLSTPQPCRVTSRVLDLQQERRLPRLAGFNSSGSTTTTDNSNNSTGFNSSRQHDYTNGSNNTFGSTSTPGSFTLPNSLQQSRQHTTTCGGSNSNFGSTVRLVASLPWSYTSPAARVHLVVSPVPAARHTSGLTSPGSTTTPSGLTSPSMTTVELSPVPALTTQWNSRSGSYEYTQSELSPVPAARVH